jgi:hypothetical protein
MSNPRPREADAGPSRALTTADLIRRIRSLDAHYLNADRWLARAQISGSPLARERYLEGRRAYERVRQTPYTIAEVGQ